MGTPSKISAAGTAIDERLRAIVGAEHVRIATDADAVAGVAASYVVVPGNEHELAATLKTCNELGLGVIPRGGGTKLQWGNPPLKADVILSTTRLDRILEHVWADLTVTVEAGCTLQKLADALALHGQRLALDALWPKRATIGGILSTNDSGSLRLRFGALRDLIIGVTIALPDGTLASSGGKVVKNVAGYDLPKLVTGAYGTLGVITRAVFRLHPLPKTMRSFSVALGSANEAQKLLLAVQDSKLAHTSLQARFVSGAQPQVDMLFEGSPAGLDAQESQFRALSGGAKVEASDSNIWHANQSLWNSNGDNVAIAKLSLLPSNLGETVRKIDNLAKLQNASWQMVFQAIGIGMLRVEGAPHALRATLSELREFIEATGGSLAILPGTERLNPLDAWGNAGDALPVMRAVKTQVDPKNTLNPGRFVGGI